MASEASKPTSIPLRSSEELKEAAETRWAEYEVTRATWKQTPRTQFLRRRKLMDRRIALRAEALGLLEAAATARTFEEWEH